ncbi:MAG TPA: tetratricopeptide repeat protein, partial [Pontiella sp.]
LGQALFRQERWEDSVPPLSYAAKNAKESRIKAMCGIMTVRALVECKNWEDLFAKLPSLYRSDSKYDITLNLTLMKAGKGLYEDAGEIRDAQEQQKQYLHSLLLYRWVLPREEMVAYSTERLKSLEERFYNDMKRGLDSDQAEARKQEISDLKESIKTLKELPPYEDEVMFRIGQIYAEVKRYWEGYALFDFLSEKDSEIGQAALLQSVILLLDAGEGKRAEERILKSLQDNPDGPYARAMLSLIMREKLMNQKADQMLALKKYVEDLSDAEGEYEESLQADLHNMMAFAYFQLKDYKEAGNQFALILNKYPNSDHYANALYYRGMTYLLEGDYERSMDDFVSYQLQHADGEFFAESMFREGVCLFGLERIKEAEAVFTRFIKDCSGSILLSEAYSMRGDIEAAKDGDDDPSTPDIDEYDPYTLDRAIADYRKAIDSATTSLQASYAAFQAAKVYKLEDKWAEIIKLMEYYMGIWKSDANVAEAVFWIGRAQIAQEKVSEAVSAYVDAILEYGNDTAQDGVDKIIFELVSIAETRLSEEEKSVLIEMLERKLALVEESQPTLQLRLKVTLASLRGDEVVATLGTELLDAELDLDLTTPASLSIMCDAAVAVGNVEAMGDLSDYFIESFEESELLWKAHRARVFKQKAEGNEDGVLVAIAEAQSLFGVEAFMGWAQIAKAKTEYKLERYKEAEASYNMCLGIAEWRGPIFAEAMYGMGLCRQATDDLETAHTFFQRTYLLFKTYSDGEWAAKSYLAAADVLDQLGRPTDAEKTLKAMLEDKYTRDHPLAEQAKELLKKYGEQS